MHPLSPTLNNLSLNTRELSVNHLNRSLATLADLYSQVKHAHWNVRGHHFAALHKLFDDLAESIEDHLDDIAERVTALGGAAQGTVRHAAATTALPEFPANAFEGIGCVTALAERYAKAGALVRQAIDETAKAGDAGTSDLFTGVSRDLDKALWFLEAHTRG